MNNKNVFSINENTKRHFGECDISPPIPEILPVSKMRHNVEKVKADGGKDDIQDDAVTRKTKIKSIFVLFMFLMMTIIFKGLYIGQKRVFKSVFFSVFRLIT